MTHILRAAALVATLAAPAAAQTGSSFDCTTAHHAVEQVICSDPGLAALDRELAALYAYALIGPDMDPARQRELIVRQTEWLQGRNGCGQAQSLEACVIASHGQRILELKTYYVGANGDGGRDSFGPVDYACDSPVPLLSAVFINGPAEWAVVTWEDNAVMLAKAPPGAGTRYTPSVWGEPFQFWTSFDEARFTIPGQGTVSCIQTQG